MADAGTRLTTLLCDEANPSFVEMVSLVLVMSLPAILSEVSTTVMQYIDAAMVGSLGAQVTASVGLVESTSWLLFGCCACAANGFSIQIAQYLGANKDEEARNIVGQSLICCGLFSLVITAIGIAFSGPLPTLLGGTGPMLADSSAYFFWITVFIPAFMVQRLSALFLQCTGDMVTPSVLNILACFLDVLFNAFFITKGLYLQIFTYEIVLPGLGWGAPGAAIGTGVATLIIAVIMSWVALFGNGRLSLKKGVNWTLNPDVIKIAGKISAPLFLERIVMNGAYIAQTIVIAPLGTVNVAANSLAVIAESACYMPGFGISQAATILVGQAFGSGKKELSQRFANYSTLLGATFMGAAGALLWFLAPVIMQVLTVDVTVQLLATRVLRIEAFAEPLYGVSMVASGALRGAGDTLAPSLVNLGSMWIVRITLAIVMVPLMGLVGMWTAMCIELNIRGAILLFRLLRGKWLDRASLAAAH